MTSIIKWIQLKIYQYELTTAVYMLEPWEKATFYSIMLVLLAMAVYSTVFYGPSYISAAILSILEYFPSLDSAFPGFKLSEIARLLKS